MHIVHSQVLPSVARQPRALPAQPAPPLARPDGPGGLGRGGHGRRGRAVHGGGHDLQEARGAGRHAGHVQGHQADQGGGGLPFASILRHSRQSCVTFASLASLLRNLRKNVLA